MAERFEIVEKALLAMLEDKKYATLRDILITMNPTDIAGLFDGLEEKQIPLMYRLLPKELAAETFVEMETEAQELLIRGFSDNELKEVLEELYVDDAADIVEEMPANVVKRILKHADPEMRHSINQILRYPENSAGSIMTTEYVSLRPHMTVGEAILRIRRQGVDKETIYTCYVTAKDRKLLGLVTVKDLLLADDDEMKIEELMQENIADLIYVNTKTDQEEVALMFNKYNFLAIPVVDGEGRMVGIVTFDDAMDVMEEEATEDMELMGGMTPSEKPYLRSSSFELFKNRIPWLMLMMVSATFTGLIMTAFEDALAAQIALSAFIPMLMGTGGNSGSQSSVTVIRGLSLGELEFSDIGIILWKEIRTALMCGVALAVVCFAKIWLIDHLLMGNNDITLMVDAVVCLALAVTVVMAKMVATLDEVIKLAGSGKDKLFLNIEIKRNGHDEGITQKVVDIIVENDYLSNCDITSQDYHTLEEVRAINPSVLTAYTSAIGIGNIETLDAADIISIQETFATYENIERIHNAGKHVFVSSPHRPQNSASSPFSWANQRITPSTVRACWMWKGSLLYFCSRSSACSRVSSMFVSSKEKI